MRFDAKAVRCVFLTLIAPCAWAQTTDHVLLKNWTAPNYWRASASGEISSAPDAPTSAAGTLHPELSTPGTGTVSVFVAITPCRLVDTRYNMPQPYGSGSSTPLVWGPGSLHSVPATGLASGTYPNVTAPCAGLPAAQAYSANITVWPQSPTTTGNKWLSVCPTGTSTANCSATAALTWYEDGTAGTAAAIVSNANVIPTNSSSEFDVYVTDNTYVIIDINGYYVSPSTLTLGSGTVAAPALTFGTDATTGIYSTGTGVIDVATGGANRLTVASNGDVGIGTTSPAHPLDVNGDINYAGVLQQGGSTFLHNTGQYNDIGLGFSALAAAGANTQDNVAIGTGAMQSDTSGIENVAIGTVSLTENTAGEQNVAVGYGSLQLDLGSANTAVGFWAGAGTGGSGTANIYLGYLAGYGDSAESYTARIGNPNYVVRFFAAGIRGTTTGLSNAVNVVVDGNGQLGTINSSRRFKEDIQDMGKASDGLMKLRPVTYRYKQPYADGSKPIDYGLIAEEVEEVYPDLVVHSADGEVETVQYQKVNVMLLNEVQKQHREIEELKAKLAAMSSLESRLAALEAASQPVGKDR